MLNLFPTPLKIVKNNSFDNLSLVDHCFKLSKKVNSGGKHWITKNIFNTSYTYNICKDKKFNKLNNWINKEVDVFVKDLGFDGFDKSKNIGWFNIYDKNNYQEWHNHNFCLASAIYYLKINKNSAKTWFKSPIPENPNVPKFNVDNPHTWSSYYIEPENGTLIIFKSDLNHCVEPHQDDSTRISLAYNFSLGDS